MKSERNVSALFPFPVPPSDRLLKALLHHNMGALKIRQGVKTMHSTELI